MVKMYSLMKPLIFMVGFIILSGSIEANGFWGNENILCPWKLAEAINLDYIDLLSHPTSPNFPPLPVKLGSGIRSLTANGVRNEWDEEGKQAELNRMVKENTIFWDMTGMTTAVGQKPVQTGDVADSIPENQIRRPLNQMPEFPGGMDSLAAWLRGHIQYPVLARKRGIQGAVNIGFAVDTDGSIINVKALSNPPLGFGCDEEAVRVAQSMPKWRPAIRNGFPVRVYFNQPIQFSLSDQPLSVEDSIPNNLISRSEVQMPVFPGGKKALSAWLHAHMQYPAKARKDGIQGIVLLRFLVRTDGSLTDLKALNSPPLGGECDREAIRFAKSMPKWIPGKQHGVPVQVFFNLPIQFSLSREPGDKSYFSPTIEIGPSVNQLPEFPGGEEALESWVDEHVHYPAFASQQGIQGTSLIQFTVQGDGSITDVKPLNYVGGGCDEAAIDVVQNMPKWIPGRIDSIPVPVFFTLPIKFTSPLDSTPEPEFPGGMEALGAWVHDHISYPALARKTGIQGPVFVQFTVDTDGSIKDVNELTKLPLGGGCDEEAIHAVQGMPKWIPGKKNGIPVLTSSILSMRFSLSHPSLGKAGSTPTIQVSEPVEKIPEFPGGEEALSEWLYARIYYPRSARNEHINGTVFIEFAVDPDGSIKDIKEHNNPLLGGGIDQEAIRVIKSMPKWKPGTVDGIPVRLIVVQPLRFRLLEP
jgi:TonB family protein